MKTKPSQGFTLIELTLVLVIFGVLGVMTIPNYLDRADQALMQAKWEKSGEVKVLFRDITYRNNNTLPSVADLAAQLPGEAVAPLVGGIQLQIDGDDYVIPTYSNSLCTRLTTSVNETVGCVGTIPS